MLTRWLRIVVAVVTLIVAGLFVTACDFSGASPVTAAFYYGWYPSTWYSDQIYAPSAGLYDETVAATVDRQIDDAKYGGIQAFIASWWGPGTVTDNQLPVLLARADAKGFSVAPYFEQEGYSNPSAATINAELDRLRSLRSQFPGSFMTVNNKPVIFVYNANDSTCDVANRWDSAAPDFYVNLKVFPGFADCANQPDSWHQYNPAVHSDSHPPFSYSISPGWWLHGASAPRLSRDLNRFTSDIQAMKNSTAKWHLVTTYNEWGEASSVESSTSWASPSGHGSFVDALHLILTS